MDRIEEIKSRWERWDEEHKIGWQHLQCHTDIKFLIAALEEKERMLRDKTELNEAYYKDLQEATQRAEQAEARVKELTETNHNNILRHVKQIKDLKRQLATAREGLLSISKNSCCDSCQEAKLVAQQTLKQMGGGALKEADHE